MADAYKILGQAAPAATVVGDIFTVAAVTTHIVSSLVICNTNASTATKVRVFARIAGAAAAVGNAIVYDLTVAAGDSITIPLGGCFATTDKLSCYSLDGGVTFTAFGDSIT